ncbi:hypothetical protein ACQJBY_026247 [Aegilops geniculata]
MFHPIRQHDAPGRPVLPCRPLTHLLPRILASCGGSHGELPWVRPIRAPVRAGQPCLDGGAGQPGGAGRCQSRPSRDCADDAQHVPVSAGYCCSPPPYPNQSRLVLMEKNLLFLEAWQTFHHATTISLTRDELVNK